MQQKNDMVKVKRIEAFITPTSPHTTVIVCHLEDGRQFYLYHVPLEIVVAINRIQDESYYMERESIFDILSFFKELLKDDIGSKIGDVYIDYLNPQTYLYSASIEIKVNGATIRKRMIPSHAIFLALLMGKNVYVSEKLVQQQEELSK